jgi:predicted RNA-binding protein Jag
MSRLAKAIGEEERARELRCHLEEIMNRIDAESHIHILPLRRLVAVQAGSGLLAMLMGKRGTPYARGG